MRLFDELRIVIFVFMWWCVSYSDVVGLVVVCRIIWLFSGVVMVSG